MINEATVRKLATRRGDPVLTSLYLDVDGRRYPRPADYERHVQHLFRLARESATRQGETIVKAVEADLARIGEWLDTNLDRQTTRGVAAFTCTAQVEALRERAAEGTPAVIGLGATLEALAAGRVRTLFVEEGFECVGGRCPQCRRLMAEGARCPSCGSVPIEVENIVDLAVTEAFVNHVALQFCERDDLADLGHIGAIERP